MAVEVTQQVWDWHSKPYSPDPCDPRYLVSSPDERGAAKALLAAMGVWGRIDEDGRIYEDWDLDLDEAYTAHYVSEVYRLPEGLYVWADTQGVLPEPMARKWIEVLVAQLDERGVEARISLPPIDALERGVPYEFDFRTDVTSDAERREEEERKWYILRSVHKRTTDGRRYADGEVWSRAGGWSADGSTAEGFDEPPHEILQQLMDAAGSDVPVATALLLPRWRLTDDSSGPPEHLRQ